MTEPAQYRASLCKSVLDFFEAHAADDAELRRAVPDGHAETIRAAGRTAWLSCRLAEDLYEVVLDVRGADALRAFNREFTRAATDLKLFGPMLKGALNMFGGGPRGMFRIIPRSWELVARGCGTLTSSIPPNTREATLTYAELPPELRTRSFVIASGASYLGILDFAGVTGQLESDDGGLDAGVVAHRVRWD